MAIEIDFANKGRCDALERARKLIIAGYRILRDEVGADNPTENAFLREARICAVAKIIWTGERGGADGRTKSGDTVEIKSTRLDERPTIAFPTSRYFSRTVLNRFRQYKLWLFGIFDVYEELIAVHRVEAKDMKPLIDVLDLRLQQLEAEGKPYANNPKFPFSAIRPRAKCLYMHPGYEDEEIVPGRWWIKRRQ